MLQEESQPASLGIRRSVHSRFLAAYIPAVIVTLAIFIAVFEVFTYRAAVSDLSQKAQRIGTNLAVVLAHPLARSDLSSVTSILNNVIQDEDVAEVKISRPDLTILHYEMRPDAHPNPALSVNRPIKLGSNLGTASLGTVHITMSDARVTSARSNRLYFIAFLSVLLLVAMAIVGSMVYRRTIGTALNQLTQVINQTEHGSETKQLSVQRNDEIGDVFRAFNRMRDRQWQHDQDLDHVRAGLERRVRERTMELKSAHDAALSANRTKSQFLANMSHEFRTPLNSIIGFSEILASGIVSDPKLLKEYATDIRESGQHLLTLTNDLLDLSKAEAGKLELHESLMDVASTIEACTSMVRNSAQQKGLTVAGRVPASSPTLSGDERKIRQMILNLLSNAVKYTPQGGTITLSSRPSPDGGLILAVQDTGIGIAEKDLERVLQPFVQVNSAYTRKQAGTGLGLPLVRILAELHGGYLTLSSTPGSGTLVSIHLPASRVQYDSRITLTGMPGGVSQLESK